MLKQAALDSDLLHESRIEAFNRTDNLQFAITPAAYDDALAFLRPPRPVRKHRVVSVAPQKDESVGRRGHRSIGNAMMPCLLYESLQTRSRHFGNTETSHGTCKEPMVSAVVSQSSSKLAVEAAPSALHNDYRAALPQLYGGWETC